MKFPNLCHSFQNSFKPILISPFSSKFPNTSKKLDKSPVNHAKMTGINDDSAAKLKALRELMNHEKYNLKAYYVPSEDAHQVVLFLITE